MHSEKDVILAVGGMLVRNHLDSPYPRKDIVLLYASPHDTLMTIPNIQVGMEALYENSMTRSVLPAQELRLHFSQE